jgi:hypothetical protein
MIEEIKALKHFRDSHCQCGTAMRVHTLQIYAKCPSCKTEIKCRAYGAIGTETQDIIDAVLEWAGEGESWEAVLRRREEILANKR